jgi:nitrogen fixation protein FixH
MNNMKFNWGYKIAAVYLIFVAGILYLVVQSSRQEVDLVTPDYYAQELRYQEKIDQRKRAAGLSEPVRYSLEPGAIRIRFPKEFAGKDITGDVLLYYPADSRKDVNAAILAEGNVMTLAIPEKRSGMHVLQVSWTSGGQSYYFEENLFIP